MGVYIQTPEARGKVEYLIREHQAETIEPPKWFDDIPEGKALIVVVDNLMFEAAGYVYCEGEFRAFLDPYDHRPKICLLMDRAKVEELTNFHWDGE